MKIENYKEVQRLMDVKYNIEHRLAVATQEFEVEVVIKNKKISGYEVYLPKEFEQVAKRVILSSLQNRLKQIEAEISEM